MDIEEFKRMLREKTAKNRKEFEGEYKDVLNDLMGLAKEDIDAITPDTTDMEIYAQLITVVEDASRVNLSQAQLKQRIQALGDIALKIAKKVPSLAKVL